MNATPSTSPRILARSSAFRGRSARLRAGCEPLEGRALLAVFSGVHDYFLGAEDSYLGAQNSAAALGDFNRDGKLDLALANEGVAIAPGVGDGTFGTPTTYPVGVGQGEVAAFSGAGTLRYDDAYTVAPYVSSLVAGPFFGPGRSDLAVASVLTGRVYLFAGQAPAARATRASS